jgi:hypothetical protein
VDDEMSGLLPLLNLTSQKGVQPWAVSQGLLPYS